jgi:AAA+ superfamily predicted ATPase
MVNRLPKKLDGLENNKGVAVDAAMNRADILD